MNITIANTTTPVVIQSGALQAKMQPPLHQYGITWQHWKRASKDGWLDDQLKTVPISDFIQRIKSGGESTEQSAQRVLSVGEPHDASIRGHRCHSARTTATKVEVRETVLRETTAQCMFLLVTATKSSMYDVIRSSASCRPLPVVLPSLALAAAPHAPPAFAQSPAPPSLYF